ncbi:MAG TPA: YybS family protein [Clostridia bacterium]|nr:YybS family protein [Clostridia bacterium]
MTERPVKDSNTSYSNVVLSGIFTVIIAFFGLFFPLISDFFWAAPIAVLTARDGLKPGILAVVFSFAALAFFVSPYWAAVSAVQFGSIGLLLGYFLSKKSSFERILLFTAVLSLVLTCLFSFWPLVQDDGLAGLTADLSRNTDRIMNMWQDMGLLESLEQQGVSAEEVKESFQTAVNWFIRLLPAILVFSALGTAFFNFLAARWGLKRIGYSLSEFPPFTRWWLPWYLSWGIIIGLGLALLGDYVSIRTIFTAGVNLVLVHMPAALVVGFSVCAFLVGKIQSRVIKIVLLIAGVFYLPLTIIIMLLVGVFDPLFDFRKIHFKSV